MITGIAHVAYVVRDMDATLDFYCTKLGFKHAFSMKNKEGAPWIEYIKVADGQFIEFFYANEGEAFSQDGYFRHLCLQVSDIHAQAKAMEAQGILLRVKPTKGADGNWQCWADDPDGNQIEFMQIDPASPQANS